MANNRVLVVGGGLAGLSATMKLAELGVPVDLLSLTPVKRSHSVCAQGGINSVNDQTRQQGDNEWNHFDDTIYGGDFLQNQPPVKEMAYWAPKVIDLMDSSIVADSVVRFTSGLRLPERRPVSNCFTLWMSKSAGTKSPDWSRSMSSGISLGRSSMITGDVSARWLKTWSRWRSDLLQPTR